jgi:protein-disulfide isomerase
VLHERGRIDKIVDLSNIIFCKSLLWFASNGMDEEIKIDDGKVHIQETISQKKGFGDYFLPISILLAGIMVSGSVVYLVGSRNSGGAPGAANVGDSLGANPLPAPSAVAGDVMKVGPRDVIMGDAKAPVTFIEYGDYQCPFCGRFFTQSEPQIRDNYVKTGKVRMIFRGFEFLGPESNAAGEAAECAKDQGKFWAFHDALYSAEIADGHEGNGNLTRDLFVKLAGNAGLNANSLATCFDSHKYAGEVEKDNADAQTVGVNSTPTSFMNGKMLQGALPYAQFAAAIDAALKSK